MTTIDGILCDLVECKVHQLRAGDTVLIDGSLRTVTGKDLKNCPFMGATLWGDCHGNTSRNVTKAIIYHAIPKSV